jgi:low temperature requirement protein LtrA
MTEVTPVGSGWRVTMYALCILMVLSGPGFLALGVLLDAHAWACSAIAAVLSLVLIPLGLTLGRDVRRSRLSQRRLAERSRAGS